MALEKTAVITRGFELCREFAPIERFPIDAERFLHQPALSIEPRGLVEPVREDHACIGDVALNAITADALAHQIDRIGGQRIQLARAEWSENAQQVRAIEAIATEHEAAVAPRCAEPDLLRFEYDDVAHAALGKTERSRQPGQPAADDAYARAVPAGQTRTFKPSDGRFIEALHKCCA